MDPKVDISIIAINAKKDSESKWSSTKLWIKTTNTSQLFVSKLKLINVKFLQKIQIRIIILN